VQQSTKVQIARATHPADDQIALPVADPAPTLHHDGRSSISRAGATNRGVRATGLRRRLRSSRTVRSFVVNVLLRPLFPPW
jgi:hypothetical protein